jgi:polar amino acid transport system permease protein
VGEETLMNGILSDSLQYLPRLLDGVRLTVLVSIYAIVAATLIGLMLEALRWAGTWGARLNSAAIIGMRGIPILVYVFFAYFALPEFGVDLSPIVAGVLALGVAHAPYMAENLRLAVQAVDQGQTEAAAAMGMSTPLLMRRVILPQAVRPFLPTFGNAVVLMIKDSSLCSVITVAELTRAAQIISLETFKTLHVFTEAALLYMALCVPLVMVIRLAEMAYSKKAAR